MIIEERVLLGTVILVILCENCAYIKLSDKCILYRNIQKYLSVSPKNFTNWDIFLLTGGTTQVYLWAFWEG